MPILTYNIISITSDLYRCNGKKYILVMWKLAINP